MKAFEGKQFDVEHVLSLYALSFITIPAAGLYDKERLAQFGDLVKDCHIYVVGFVPKIDLKDMTLEGVNLIMTFEVLGKRYDLKWILDEGVGLVEKDGAWFLTKDGELADPPGHELCLDRLNREFGTGKFLVKYIGQAYGKDGARNALDRLIKHEKLQEISIKGVPEGHHLQIVMFAIATTRVLTSFNPFAKDKSKSDERIGHGLDKLFGTSEKERVALYEAALIRYFMPAYNIEFKDSFPSTNLNILQDCYDKDFSGVVAEILFEEEFPLTLYSETVKPKDHHTAYFDLHDDDARRSFFAGPPKEA